MEECTECNTCEYSYVTVSDQWNQHEKKKKIEINETNFQTQVTSGNFYWPLHKDKKDKVGC